MFTFNKNQPLCCDYNGIQRKPHDIKNKIYSIKRVYRKNWHDSIHFLCLQTLLTVYNLVIHQFNSTATPVFPSVLKQRLSVGVCFLWCIQWECNDHSTENQQTFLHLQQSIVTMSWCFWVMKQKICSSVSYPLMVHSDHVTSFIIDK